MSPPKSIEVITMTQQDWLISIENAVEILIRAGKTADVEHVFRVFGRGARCAEDLSPGDYDTVFGELHHRLADLEN